MDGVVQLPGGFRVGLDPILGLIPGIGDMISAAASSVIVVQAHRAGIPRATLLRMVANVGVDAAVGAIPFLGDLFDFAVRANQRNVALYREARAGVRDTRRDWLFLAMLLAMMVVFVAIPVYAALWLAQRYLG
jgi:hypothetical protein